MSWDIPPSVFADVVIDDVDKMYRGFLITCWNDIIIKSPVDTGAYRGNHILSFGSPDYTYDMNEKGVMAMGVTLAGVPKGKFPTAYIQNNLPYAAVIEFGGYPNPPKRGSYDKKEQKYVIKSTGGYSKHAPQGVYALAFEYAVAKYA